MYEDIKIFESQSVSCKNYLLLYGTFQNENHLIALLCERVGSYGVTNPQFYVSAIVVDK